MLRLLLFIILVGVPIAEIALFITVGEQIGALPTILIIIATAVLGTALLRRQGAAAVRHLRADLDAGRVPAAAIGQAVTIAIAGLLLLTPGFMTDAVGFALFIPAVRRFLWRQISSSVKVRRVDPSGPRYEGGSANPFGAGGPFGPRERPRTHPGTINLDGDDYTERRDGPAGPGAPPRDDSPWRGG